MPAFIAMEGGDVLRVAETFDEVTLRVVSPMSVFHQIPFAGTIATEENTCRVAVHGSKVLWVKESR